MKNNTDTNGKRLNLFPMKKKKSKVSNNQAFNMMNTVSDKSNVDINTMGDIDKSTKGIHNVLMAAGMTPAIGNVADLADAALYALEGELGDAAWSAAAAIPLIGQMVAGRKALKVAKESGEEMVTLYRGIQKWHKGTMVTGGKFKGGSPIKKWQFDAMNFNIKDWIKRGVPYDYDIKNLPYKENLKGTWTASKRLEASNYRSLYKGDDMSKSAMLEFEVPKSFIKKTGIKTQFGIPDSDVIGDVFLFPDGLPKEFLKKVHKWWDR